MVGPMSCRLSRRQIQLDGTTTFYLVRRSFRPATRPLRLSRTPRAGAQTRPARRRPEVVDEWKMSATGGAEVVTVWFRR